MSIQIPVAFEQKYKRDFVLLSEQQGSRLAGTVRTEPDRLEGKAGHFDRIGNIEMTEIIGRHQPTQITNTPHSRRRVTLRDYAFADAVDWQDVEKMSKDPKPAYVTKGMRAAGRQRDRLIIAAARGNATAVDENDGTSLVALPAGQKIAAGAAGLTLLKLTTAKEKLDAAEVDESVPRFCVVSAQQLNNLLNITSVTSSDFNTIKALVRGEIDTYLGFKFIRTQLLPKVATSRFCLAYAQTAIGLATGTEPMVDMGVRRDLNLAVQVYVGMGMDCVRIEEEQVVEIECTEV